MVFSFSQVSRGGFPHLFGGESLHLYVLFIFSVDLVYLFPLQAFIFYRLLPFSLDMCLISLSSRNFSNILNCFLASFFGGKNKSTLAASSHAMLLKQHWQVINDLTPKSKRQVLTMKFHFVIIPSL